mmetsp:Transcript_26959/g.63047  ORF Transcript_26959/g.63047 Transcript_26959/m.63047 type:complete len:255 (+) Transcript_26959:249-1013(+)
MSSVVVSGDSSSDGESSEVSGGEDNPIEIDDSTSRNSESDSEMPPAGPIYSNITAKADPDKETDRGEGNHSGEDGDEENSDDEGDSAERSSESPAVNETEIDRNESDDDGDGDDDTFQFQAQLLTSNSESDSSSESGASSAMAFLMSFSRFWDNLDLGLQPGLLLGDLLYAPADLESVDNGAAFLPSVSVIVVGVAVAVAVAAVASCCQRPTGCPVALVVVEASFRSSFRSSRHYPWTAFHNPALVWAPPQTTP